MSVLGEVQGDSDPTHHSTHLLWSAVGQEASRTPQGAPLKHHHTANVPA